jgi:hypothetical protein
VRINLFELDLMLCNGVAFSVEDEKSGAGGAVIDSADEGFISLVMLLELAWSIHFSSKRVKYHIGCQSCA